MAKTLTRWLPMIQFRLNTLDQKRWISAGARSRVRFADGILCRDHDLQSMAHLHDEKWFFGEEGFDEVRFQDAVLAVFQGDQGDRSHSHGPYRDFHTEDGHAYADGKLFACYEESSGGWREVTSGTLWRTITIVEAMPGDTSQASA